MPHGARHVRGCARGAILLVAALALAAPALAQARDMYATTDRGELIRFDSRFPGILTDRVAITGLGAGAALVGIDFRPSTGQLVGVGSDGVAYVIDPGSGGAQPIGPPFSPGLSGTAFGVEVDPVLDALRVVSDTGQNLRISLATGAHLPGSPGAQLGPGAPHVVALGAGGSAFSSLRPAATTLAAVDSASDQVLVLSPAGTLGDGKALGIDIGDPAGLDLVFVPGIGDVAYMVATPAGATGASLYRVSLITGRAFRFGAVGTGSALGRGRPRLTLTGFAARQPFLSPGLNIPPDVRIIPSSQAPRPGRRSLYLAYATDHDGGVVRVEWDTNGDGRFGDATGERLTRAFPTGVRTLAVRVTDNSGAHTTDTLRVVVPRR
jgi:hypothetical protein